MSLEYSIELDHSIWVPVPLEFPWNGFPDASTWSTDLASSLLEGFDAPLDVEKALQRSAFAVAAVDGPFPGAMERFWHFPVDGGSERLAHLYISEYPDHGESAIRSIATAGIGGYVQVLEPLDGTGFDEAARTVVIGETDTGDRNPIFLARFVGLVSGLVFIIEVVESNSAVLQELLDPVESLFRSISVREGEALPA